MFGSYRKSSDSFIIAEVGQNHQGDLQNARDYIREFAQRGADAVKFQTRDNKVLFDAAAYEAPYQSENAFADTYGAHREFLELDPAWLPLLKKDCEQLNVKFISTPFDESSLDLLMSVGVDALKIASFDLGNLPFIEQIARRGLPVVMSIGGGQGDQIADSVELLLMHDIELAVLHCVSEYPCDFDKLGLENIEILTELFPGCTIGLSDHFNGTLSGPVGFLKGARVFEKHVTLNRAWKGTDHSFALEPEGFRKFVRDIRRTPKMLSKKSDEELGTEYVFKKLGKSLIAKRMIYAGESLSLGNLGSKIFQEEHIPVRLSNELIGRVVTENIDAGEPITLSKLTARP